MGSKEQKSQTDVGLKYIYQYFILHFSLILALLLLSTILALSGQDMLSISASKLYFVVAIVFLFIVVFIWFVRGIASILNGRMEFPEPHQSNVILGTILLIGYIMVYFTNLPLSQGFTGGTAFVAAASNGFSSAITGQFIASLVLSVTSHILLGFALRCLVLKFVTDEQKKKLNKAFVLLVAGTFTVNITTLIAYYLFFKIYKNIYQQIIDGKLKPAIIAPCPNCSRDIPIESMKCQFCGAKFEKKVLEEVDPRLTFSLPESQYKLPKGFTPFEGPTEAQKKKLFYFIGLIIVIIIIVVTLSVIF